MKTIRPGIFGTAGDIALSMDYEKIDSYLNKQRNAVLTLKCKYILPSYTLLHYCEEFIQTFLKQQTLSNLLDIINEFDVSLSSIYISTKHKELLPYNIKDNSKTNLLSYHDAKFKDFCCLIHNETINSEFFDIFKKLQRPDIYILMDDYLYPLYDINQRSAIHLKSLSVNSPGTMSFFGSIDSLSSTFKNLQDNKRADILFKSQLSGELLNTLERYASLQSKLNSSNIPDGARIYIESLSKEILAKQSQLATYLNIKEMSIDTTA